MNVLIIINSFRLGGAEKLCYDLARKLALIDGITVFLYSIGKVENKLEQEMFASFAETSVIVGSYNKPYKRKRIQTICKIRKFCEKEEIDVVHTNGQSPDFYVRCTKLFNNTSKSVVTIHNTAGYSRIIEKLFYKYTDAYTAVSADALNYSINNLGIKRKIELINNGIDISVYSDIKKETECFEILSVGRIQPQKDYIKAAQFIAPFLQRHTDAKWVIYGDYSSNREYYKKFRCECEKLRILESVEFRGVVSNPREIYCHGKVFLLASSYEGFGIAFIEAIMSGHFIFSRDVGVVLDVLKSGGVVHNIDCCESMEFLESIYSNNVHTNELEKNIMIIEKNFSIDSMVEKYVKVYYNVLSGLN